MNKQDGFTLIEILVYIGLFSLIMVGLLASALTIFQGFDRNQTKIIVQEEGDFLLSKINWALTGATSVTITASPQQLSITRSSSPTSISFNSALQLNRGVSNVTLNNSNVTISGLSYSESGHATSLWPVTVAFTLSSKTGMGQTYSQTFTTTKYIKQ
jgi:type II secretory pathway pseudopilin PulG